MKTVARNWFPLFLAILVAVGSLSGSAFGSSPSARKRSKSDRDIDAIGHRTIAYGPANWYSLEKEKEIGQELSSSLERSTALLRDARTAAYLDRLAQAIAQNSDVQMPVTVRVIDSEEVYALTLPGG